MLGRAARSVLLGAGVAMAGLSACGGSGAPAPTEAAIALPRAVGVTASAPVDALGFDARGGVLAVVGRQVYAVGPDGSLGDVVVPKRDEAPLGFSPDGRVLLTQGGTEVIAQATAAPFEVRWRAPIPYSAYDEPRAYWSADSRRIVVATDGGRIVLDAGSGKRIAALPTGTYYLGSQPLSPDGTRLVDSTERLTRIWRVADRKVRALPIPGADAPAWSPDGRTIAADGKVGELILIDVASGASRTVEIPIVPGAIAAIHWSPDSRYVGITGTKKDDTSDPQEFCVAVVDVRSGRSAVVATMEGRGEEETEPFAWSRDSRQIAYVRKGG